MVLKLEVPPPQHQGRKAIRVTDDTHSKLVEMAKMHKTSIAKFVGALTDAHLKHMQERKIP